MWTINAWAHRVPRHRAISWSMRPLRGQAGFSLLELLVVVTILAVVAGGMILKQGETVNDAKLSVALSEMTKVKAAILQFRLDMGRLPNPTNPANPLSLGSPGNFNDLYDDTNLPNWNPDTRRGWRGPYLTTLGEGFTDIGAGLLPDGNGSPIAGAQVQNIRSVADPFVHFPATPGSYVPCVENPGNTNCLLDWRTLPGDEAHDRHGRPYLVFDMTNEDRARLVSMGQNGRYEGAACTTSCDQCAPGGDDLQVCLLR